MSRWRDVTPEDFVFAIKASRFITHIKRLEGPAETVTAFLDRVASLASKLGPVLFQLPSRFPFNGDKLDTFRKVLSRDIRYTFEFRDPGWSRQETCDILSQHNMAFCIYNYSGTLSPDAVTADFVSIRFHGPLKEPYRGAYPDSWKSGRGRLKFLAPRCQEFRNLGKGFTSYYARLPSSKLRGPGRIPSGCAIMSGSFLTGKPREAA